MHKCLTCDLYTDYDQCEICNPEAFELNDEDLIAEQLRAQPYIDDECGIFSRTICNKADCSMAIDGDTNNNYCRHHYYTEDGVLVRPEDV